MKESKDEPDTDHCYPVLGDSPKGMHNKAPMHGFFTDGRGNCHDQKRKKGRDGCKHGTHTGAYIQKSLGEKVHGNQSYQHNGQETSSPEKNGSQNLSEAGTIDGKHFPKALSGETNG